MNKPLLKGKWLIHSGGQDSLLLSLFSFCIAYHPPLWLLSSSQCDSYWPLGRGVKSQFSITGSKLTLAQDLSRVRTDRHTKTQREEAEEGDSDGEFGRHVCVWMREVSAVSDDWPAIAGI